MCTDGISYDKRVKLCHSLHYRSLSVIYHLSSSVLLTRRKKWASLTTRRKSGHVYWNIKKKCADLFEEYRKSGKVYWKSL